MKQKLPLLVTALLIIAIYFLGKSISPEVIQNFVQNSGGFGPIIVILLALVAYTFAPLSGSPVLVAGYYLYGVNVIWLMNAAAVISYAINFWIARKLGRPYIGKLVGQENAERIDKFTKNRGLETLFLLRIFAGGFHDFISYAWGLTAVKFKDYFVTSVVAAIPGTLFWYFISLSTDSIEEFLVVNFALLGIFLFVWFLINRLFKLH